MNKNARVEIRLSQAERAKLQKQADECGMTISELIRSFINHGAVHPRPTADFHEFSTQLRRIGNNLNQVTALAHTKGFIDTLRLNDLIDELWTLEKEAGEMIRRNG